MGVRGTLNGWDETSTTRGRAVTARCVGCGTGIKQTGGKKRCAPCAHDHNTKQDALRDKARRERKKQGKQNSDAKVSGSHGDADQKRTGSAVRHVDGSRADRGADETAPRH